MPDLARPAYRTSPGRYGNPYADDRSRHRQREPSVCRLANHVCHIFPHPLARKQRRPRPKAELGACSQAAGGNESREHYRRVRESKERETPVLHALSRSSVAPRLQRQADFTFSLRAPNCGIAL